MERTIYECDWCGEQFGAKNDVAPVPIRRQVREWLPYREYTLHFCFGCEGSAAVDLNNTGFKRFLVNEGDEVIGCEWSMREIYPLSDFPEDRLADPAALDAAVDAVEDALGPT
jgi:hypothetical protein